MSLATSTTLAQAQRGLYERIAFGIPIMLTWLWSVSLISGVRPRWFVRPVTGLLVLLFLIHLFVTPLNSSVVSIGQFRLPWGEVISNPKLGEPKWWFGPVSALVISI